jgi:hypothetical protein
MTVVKEQAVQMLKKLPDEKVIFLIKIMEGLEGLGTDAEVDEKKAALDRLQKFRGRLPENFDYEQELMEAREERYAGTR